MWNSITENWEIVVIIIGVIYTLACIYEKIGTIFKEKKLEFIMYDHVESRVGALDWYDDYTRISIINKGKRPVIIEELKIASKNKGFVYLENIKSIRPKLPYTLAVDKKMNLEIIFDDMVHISNYSIAKGLISGDKKIVFIIEDGSGKIHKIKSNQTAEWFIKYRRDALENDFEKVKRLKKSILKDDSMEYMDYIYQLTYLLFIKMFSEGKMYPNIRCSMPAEFGWDKLKKLSGADLTTQYNETLTSLSKMDGIIGAICTKAQNKINDHDNLKRLISLIDVENWSKFYRSSGHSGTVYEGLLDNNSRAIMTGADQYFTPRPLIKAIVDVMRPSPEMTVTDPACGTGGFLLAAYAYMKKQTNDKLKLKDLKIDKITGNDINPFMVSLSTMNLCMHGIGGEVPPIKEGDSFINAGSTCYDMVITNPPLVKINATRMKGEDGCVEFEFITMDEVDHISFLKNVMTMLKSNGCAAVVIPNRILFEGVAGEWLKERLPDEFNLHTIWRLPFGICSSSSSEASVIFFDKQPVLNDVNRVNDLWIYDSRMKGNPCLNSIQLCAAQLKDFVKCYRADDVSKRRESKRFKKYTCDDAITRDETNLNITELKHSKLERLKVVGIRYKIK